VLSLAIIFGTYVYGTLQIALWLANSVNRTTIFAQIVLYAYIAVWLVLGVEGAAGRTKRNVAEADASLHGVDRTGAPEQGPSSPEPAFTSRLIRDERFD
jgi:hypothetical protein